MNGRLHGQIESKADGWKNREMDRLTENRSVDRKEGQINRWMDGSIDRQTNG